MEYYKCVAIIRGGVGGEWLKDIADRVSSVSDIV